MSEFSYRSTQSVEATLNGKCEKKIDSKGNEYLSIEDDEWVVGLFPSKIPVDPAKKSHLMFNAQVRSKATGIRFRSEVKCIMTTDKEGQTVKAFIMGEKEDNSSYRAMIHDYVVDKTGAGKSYPRLSIPGKMYGQLIDLVRGAIADSGITA